jgi:hypothetical protein
VTTTDPELHAAQADLARILGKPLTEIQAMTMDDILDGIARTSFHTLGLELACNYEDDEEVHLMD